MKKIIVAIDGPASSGKSTLAKQLSMALDYDYIDSGAYYRALTLYFLENEILFNDEPKIQQALKSISIHYAYDKKTNQPQTLLNGRNVEGQIRSMKVSEEVSAVSTIAMVRKWVVKQLQLRGKNKSIVMDGRDIGTAVFPSAELKIFLVADESQRIQRRLKELQKSHAEISENSIKQNIMKRDWQDVSRTHAPLKQADDAVVIDNSNLSTNEQFELALQLAKDKINS
jgi:cytidylate kinase